MKQEWSQGPHEDGLVEVVLTALTKVQVKSINKDMILRSQSFIQQHKRK